MRSDSLSKLKDQKTFGAIIADVLTMTRCTSKVQRDAQQMDQPLFPMVSIWPFVIQICCTIYAQRLGDIAPSLEVYTSRLRRDADGCEATFYGSKGPPSMVVRPPSMVVRPPSISDHSRSTPLK